MRPRIYHALPISLLVAALLLLASPGEAIAQQQENSQNDLNLPAWSQSKQGSQTKQPAAQRSQQQDPPPPPPPPPQVPLGGLEWLALAGGAYAVNRLRRRGDDDDEEGNTDDALP